MSQRPRRCALPPVRFRESEDVSENVATDNPPNETVNGWRADLQPAEIEEGDLLVQEQEHLPGPAQGEGRAAQANDVAAQELDQAANRQNTNNYLGRVAEDEARPQKIDAATWGELK